MSKYSIDLTITLRDTVEASSLSEAISKTVKLLEETKAKERVCFNPSKINAYSIKEGVEVYERIK